MGRFWLGAALLAALLILGLWIGRTTDWSHETISKMLDMAAEQVMAGDTAEGLATAQAARRRWHRGWNATAAIADHAPMDEIDGLFAQLEIYGQLRSPMELAAVCARLSALVSAMGEAHQLTWWNLL